jgi:hypothetical protein
MGNPQSRRTMVESVAQRWACAQTKANHYYKGPKARNNVCLAMLLGNPSTRSMTRLETEYVETRSRARVGFIWQASNAKRVKHTSTKSMYNVHIAEYFAMTREFLQFLLSISLADTTLKQVKTNPQNTVVRIEWRYQAASCLEREARCTAEMDPRRHHG